MLDVPMSAVELQGTGDENSDPVDLVVRIGDRLLLVEHKARRRLRHTSQASPRLPLGFSKLDRVPMPSTIDDSCPESPIRRRDTRCGPGQPAFAQLLGQLQPFPELVGIELWVFLQEPVYVNRSNRQPPSS